MSDFPSRAAGYKVIRKMIDQGQIKHVYLLREGNNRPTRVLSNYPVKNCLRHEVMITKVLLALGRPFHRYGDTDEILRPDAEILADQWHYVEVDCSSERGRKIEDRLAIYESVGSPVLWVVTSDERRQSLMKKTVNDNAYFSLYSEVLEQPHGCIWRHRNGEDWQLVTG